MCDQVDETVDREGLRGKSREEAQGAPVPPPLRQLNFWVEVCLCRMERLGHVFWLKAKYVIGWRLQLAYKSGLCKWYIWTFMQMGWVEDYNKYNQ